MPLTCHGLHDWSSNYTERTKSLGRAGLPITRLRMVKRCLACGEIREVFPESVMPLRIEER